MIYGRNLVLEKKTLLVDKSCQKKVRVKLLGFLSELLRLNSNLDQTFL